MKSRPILFNGPMVRALLDGSKTQTRRVCKPAIKHGLSYVIPVQDPAYPGQCPPYITPGWFGDEEGDIQFFSPYGQPGDQLWVRETWGARFSHADFGAVALHWNDLRGPLKKYRTHQNLALYAMSADGQYCGGWIPSIHMPRWASRITLEVTGVRVERLQNISEADALAEGVSDTGAKILDSVANEVTGPIAEYSVLWESINGPGSWDLNPWVWVVEFRRLS